MKNYVLIFSVLLYQSNANTVLFPDSGLYVYSITSSISTGSVLPNPLFSAHGFQGLLSIQKYSPSAVIAKLSSLKHAIYNENANLKSNYTYEKINNNSEILTKPFVISFRDEGTVGGVNFTENDILWSMNIKRAIAASLQLQIKGKTFPVAFKQSEPCIYGDCVVEYSSSNGQKIRKSNSIPTLAPSAAHDLSMSVRPNICSRDTKNPLIGNVDRWYTMDEKGLAEIVSDGIVEVHYHNHIFRSQTSLHIERMNLTNESLYTNGAFPIHTTVAFQPPLRNEPTGGRAPLHPSKQLALLWEVLRKIADGLEQLELTDALLKDKLPLRLQEIISTLSYETLKEAHDELELGTSYRWETMKNIFLEVLPQVKSKPAILLIRDMVVNRKLTEESTILQLLRRMPFNAGDLSQNLLIEMEPLMKLSQDNSREVRHAAILAFSTLVFKTFEAGACSADAFEDYVQIFFSRFTESPDYADRLVWLSGLSNLQLERVTSYLAPVIQGKLGHTSNERFLAVWATMGIAHMYPTEVHNTYWPILENTAEPLEMRIAAITMLILGEPSTHRLLSLHWYISAQSNQYIKNFFYTTIKSLEKTTYDCYKHMSKLASYLTKVIKPPPDRHKLWATGNYLFDMADVSRDMGFMFQVLSIANPLTGLPDVVYSTLIAHNGGLIVQDYAVYLKLQGVVSNIFEKLYQLNGIPIKEIIATLNQLKVQPRPVPPVHVELLVKYQGKVIYALHVNQTTADKMTEDEIMKKIDGIIKAESHVNQQILLYPTILKSILPSEIGTPIITDTMLSTLTSIRGNLTYSPKDDEISRKNDVHFRTSTLALLSLSAYDPFENIFQMADVAQVSDAYLPANFTIALSLTNKNLRTTWFNPKGNQSPGFVAYSGSKISTVPQHKMTLDDDKCENCPEGMINNGKYRFTVSEPGIEVQCFGSTTAAELFWQLITSHSSNANVLPIAKPILLLIHGVVLGSLPAKGPCELVISTSTYNNVQKRTDIELGLLLHSDDLDKIGIELGTITRSDDDKQELISTFNITNTIEWTDNVVKLEIAAMKKNFNGEWKGCLNIDQFYDRDVESQMKSILLNATMSTDQSPERCPTEGTVLTIDIIPEAENKSSRRVDLKLKLKDMASNVTSLLSKYNDALNILEYSSPIEEFHIMKFLTNKLSQTNVDFNASVISAEDHLFLELQDEKGMTNGLWKTNMFSWLLNGEGKKWNFFKEMGITKQCLIRPSNILDMDENEVKLRSSADCELLALGECTKAPQFAVLKLPSPYGLALRVHMGGYSAEIQPNSTNLLVSVNGKIVNYHPSYQFPEHDSFYDMKISGSDETIRIESKTNALEVIYNRNEAKITIPAAFLPTSCGACLQTQTLYTKC